MREQLLKLLYEYSQTIKNARSDFHNVNQWSEEYDGDETCDEKIENAFKKLESAINGKEILIINKKELIDNIINSLDNLIDPADEDIIKKTLIKDLFE